MDPGEIRDLYEKYGFLILGRCRRILGSEQEAWDALQDVFVKLIENYETLRQKQRVVAWVYTAATNHCFNLLRRRKRMVREGEYDEMRSHEDLEQRLSARDIITHVMRWHGVKVRDAVYYTYVEELDQREIQKLTGQSPATIRRNLKRFKDSLPAIKKRLLS
jgi:RNA polymerase sigma-70 factor (ECF subfamily)